MARSKVAKLPEFSDLFKTALDSSVALWPLFLIRLVFLMANWFFFGLCLVICCFPLVKFILEHLDDFMDAKKLQELLQGTDFLGFFTNSSTWILLLALGVFWFTFVCFFFAFYDSAVYSQLRANQEDGEEFSFKQFIDDGIRFTMPMIGLQAAWFLLVIGYLLGFAVVVVLGVLLCTVLPVWIGVLAAIPAFFLFLAGFIVLVSAAGLAGAYLVQGQEVWECLKNGLIKSIEHKGRAIWAVFLILLLYMVFNIACNVVFTVLGLIPVIGLLFKLVLFGVNSIMAIGLNIYLDSLCVALTLEPKVAD